GITLQIFAVAVADQQVYRLGEEEAAQVHIGFPIFDRHHHHRYPIWGYQGALNVMVWILDRIHMELDRNSMGVGTTDFSYDIIR
ncbi:MAG: nitrogenase component 1, partial [Methylocella sp.]